jgi:hypothetical protein
MDTGIGAEVNTRNLWSTPTVTLLLNNSKRLVLALEDIILREEAALRGKRRSTPVAGLTSGLTTYWLEYNVLKWNYPEIAEFRGYVLRGIREFIKLCADPDDPQYQVTGISCWANVLRPGESLHVHHHDPSFVSAHFTVKTGFKDETGGPFDAGHTIYYRPGFIDRSHGGEASAAPSPWDDDWQMSAKPVEGRLFLFPSYVRHEVRPYIGDTYRISIAMDVFIKKQKLPIHFGGARWYVPDGKSQ